MAEPTPIEERLDRLRTQYEDFIADPRARLLHWVVKQDEVSMVDTLFALESDENGQFADLWVRLTSPFQTVQAHGFALRAELIAQVRAAEEEFRAEDDSIPSWVPPAPSHAHDDRTAFLADCASWRNHLGELADHLVLFLRPTNVVDVPSWETWLTALIRASARVDVRFVVLDPREHVLLGTLAAQEPTLVRTKVADLDMARAAVDICANASDLDTPDGLFRDRFVRLGQALADDDSASAKRNAFEALTIATAQKWWHLASAVHFTVGSALLGGGKAVDAIERFRQAESFAHKAEGEGEPYGLTLRVKARLAIASAMISVKAHAQAAPLMVETVPLAERAGEPLMQLECWRLASHCYEQCKQPEGAWKTGLEALGVGNSLDEDTRRASTLPYVGEALIRMAKKSGRHDPGAIDKAMTDLLGRDWRPKDPGAFRPATGATPS